MKALEIKVFDSHNIWFNLFMFKTKKEMVNRIKKDYSDANVNKNTSGYFRPTSHMVSDEAPGRFTSNIIGAMYINIEEADEEIVAHECGHATFNYEHYLRRYNGKFNSDDTSNDEWYFNGGSYEQEAFCYFLGIAYKKAWQAIKLYKRELKA